MIQKYYPEDVLIQKLQDGEIDHLDYILYHSPEWNEQYKAYCRKRGMTMDNESARKFIDHKENELEDALENGEA